MTKIKKIYFVHEGKAYYPAIIGHRKFLDPLYACEEVGEKQLAHRKDLHESVCWYMMGYYRSRPKDAAFVIHDYRSLSLGNFRTIKDFIKRYGNARPDLRIIQTEGLRKIWDFDDGVPCILQEIAVPNHVVQLRNEPNEMPVYDFAYVGMITSERKMERMIDSFLRRFGSSKRFILIGAPERSIQERYAKNTNIVFAGRQPQHIAFRYLLKARCTVCYFPDHPPHIWQTPTKLLEAAALGVRILANHQPMSHMRAAMYDMKVRWGTGEDLFSDVPDALDWDDNRSTDPTPMLWSTVIEKSGIMRKLAALEASFQPALKTVNS